ncbi:nitrate reductase [Shewanella sp. Sh95]|uniref:DUF1924 domain-containing protein n=1 Tax=Shewanella sp. Sh95 TaxID=1689868 RepID=UPI0006DA6347|nr:DUF1924 domain-containing protein [Shewanella sp. Sh95]KPN78152.1 nitrate reductase [Shewanella sp. Sh95]
MNNNLNKSLMGLALTVVLLSSVNASAANTKVASLPLSAERIGLQLQQYQAQGAGPFSAAAGQVLWLQQSEDRSCASCHTAKVTDSGMHQNTRKPIEAMAPSLTSNRLTDAAKIEKWFTRNCNWTFKRECTPQEKGDVLLWLSLQ